MGKLELGESKHVHTAYVLTTHPQVIHKSYARVVGKQFQLSNSDNKQIVILNLFQDLTGNNPSRAKDLLNLGCCYKSN